MRDKTTRWCAVCVRVRGDVKGWENVVVFGGKKRAGECGGPCEVGPIVVRPGQEGHWRA